MRAGGRAADIACNFPKRSGKPGGWRADGGLDVVSKSTPKVPVPIGDLYMAKKKARKARKATKRKGGRRKAAKKAKTTKRRGKRRKKA